MATNDTHQAADSTVFWQKLNAMVAAATDTKKKYDTDRAALSDNDYEAAVIANMHIQVVLPHRKTTTRPPSSPTSCTHYTRWCDNILLTLGCYSLSLSL
jgi:hypothetical protein